MTASWYSIFLCSKSCTADSARISHNGGLVGSLAHRLQVEYTTRDISFNSPFVRRAPLAAILPFSARMARMSRNTPLFMSCGQFRIIRKYDLTVRLHQHNVALGRHHTGIPVKCDLVRVQHVTFLPRLDMALSGHQRIVPVVFHRVGGERHGLIARSLLMLAATDQCAKLCPCRAGQCYDKQQSQQQTASKCARSPQGSRHAQPSSVCSNSATASIMPEAAGAQAASATGSAPD